MSLIEPLLPKEDAGDQKVEKYSHDPLVNLEKSIQKLSVEFKSYDIDGANDIEFRDKVSQKVWEFYGSRLKTWDIGCTVTFGNNLVIGRIDGIIKIYNLDTKEERILAGHSNAVTCLQVTIKNDFLVSGSRDKTINIWNLETYEQERVFRTENEVFCLVATSGYNLFSGSFDDGLIRKWNFWDENDVNTLSGHKSGIICMKSSKNNHFLVTGSIDNTLRIWSIESNQELKVFNDEGCWVICQILITEDDKYLVCLYSNYISLWDLNNGEVINKIELYNCMNINNASKCIIYNTPNKITSYNIENQAENKEILINGDIEAIACSSKNDLVYYGLQNNTVAIIDAKSSNIFAEFKEFDGKVYKMLLVGNNDEYLASIMENGKIKIHEIYKKNMQDDYVIDTLTKDQVIRLTRDRKRFICSNYQSLSIWNYIEQDIMPSSEKFNLVLKTEISCIGDVKISYDYNYFVFSCNNMIYVCSFEEMKEIASFDVETPWFCFSISKDNQFIVVGKQDGSIVVFDFEKKSKISTLEGLHTRIWKVEINKTNDYLVSLDYDKTLIFWSFLEKKIIKSLHFDQNLALLILNDKYNYAVVGGDSWIEIWDLWKLEKIVRFEDAINKKCMLAAISEDETYLLFRLEKGVTMWSFECMKEIESDMFNYDVDFLDITRDNKYILVGEDEKCVRVWSCEEKRFFATIDFFGFKIVGVKFIEDGKSIFAWNSDHVRIHNLEKHFDCGRADPYLYFFSHAYDKVLLKEFISWIKSPSEHPWNNLFLDIVVGPIGYNALHFLCIQDRADLLSIALKNEGEIFRDNQNMSPLSYALIRSSRRCIDEILSYVVNLEDDKKQHHCIHQLRDDIPLLFNLNSPNLVPILEVLFRRRGDKDHVGFYEVIEELPMSIFSPISKIHTSNFTGENDIEKKGSAKQNMHLLQFWGSPWGYNYTVGSEESLFLLKKLDESQNDNIFQTLIVQSIIREKWEYLWPAVMTISIIYWLNLISMIWHIFDPNIYSLVSFVVLNGILTLYEFLQFSTKPIDYVSELWNLVDCIRIALSFTWAVLDYYEESIEVLTFAAAFFSLLKGLTYFRAFDFTRFYVRLILMALSDSFAFLIIFLYSTLAFGILYATLDSNLSFRDMWAKSYELNMGNFDNDGFSFIQYLCFTLATLINVVVMLNLLVSTLGDTYDRFQMTTDELDSKEMLQLVIEFESVMFWARSEKAKLRNKDKLMYLQRCDHFQNNDMSDKWQGKIKEISLKIDAVKDDVFGIKKNVNEDSKKLEDKIESINGKIEEMESKINRKAEVMESKINKKVEAMESKISGMVEMLGAIKTKLDA